MNREAKMTRTESHPTGTVRLVSWPKVVNRHEADCLVAPPFGYHHVPGYEDPTKSTYRWLRRLFVIGIFSFALALWR